MRIKEIKEKWIVLLVLLAILVLVLCIYACVRGTGAWARWGADEEAEGAEDAKNLLFLGTDREAGLCDVVMLVSVDAASGRVFAAQIPRDTYARYTDGSYKKLNGAYNALGGAAETAEWLSSALGIEIHHYVCVGLDTVREAVDALGGVEVDIPCDMQYSDPSQGLEIRLSAGKTLLNGEMAEQFLRYRASYTMGDVERLDAQKIFLAALFDRLCSSLSVSAAIELLCTLDGVETDLCASEIAGLLSGALSADADSVLLCTLAGREAIAEESGACYYVLSADAAADVMKKYFGGGEFDRERRFLNPRYEDFEAAYFEAAQARILSVSEIRGGGLSVGG